MPGIPDITESYVTRETLDRETVAWMRDVAPYQWRPVAALSRAVAALLVVDMTRPFVEPGNPLASPNAQAVVSRVGDMVSAFRRAQRPVLWIVQGHHSVAHDRGPHLAAWWPTPLLEGTDDLRLAAGLNPLADKIIVKRRYSGFFQTDLECTLRCLGVKQLAIAGVLTHMCPYLTAADAFMRDFAVYYLADGTASINRTLHVAALQNVAGWCGHVVTVRQVADWLAA